MSSVITGCCKFELSGFVRVMVVVNGCCVDNGMWVCDDDNCTGVGGLDKTVDCKYR